MAIADTGIFENIKEKISNPIMFTYFWVFCLFNRQELLLLFFEPKLFSAKLYFFDDLNTYTAPLLGTLFVLLVFPWLNNLVELWRQKAHKSLQTRLHLLGWVPMVDAEKHQKSVDKINTLKDQLAIESNKIEEQESKHSKIVSNLEETLNQIKKIEKEQKGNKLTLESEKTGMEEVDLFMESTQQMLNDKVHNKNESNRADLLEKYNGELRANRIKSAESDKNPNDEYVLNLANGNKVLTTILGKIIIDKYITAPDEDLIIKYEGNEIKLTIKNLIIASGSDEDPEIQEKWEDTLNQLVTDNILVDNKDLSYKLTTVGLELVLSESSDYSHLVNS